MRTRVSMRCAAFLVVLAAGSPAGAPTASAEPDFGAARPVGWSTERGMSLFLSTRDGLHRANFVATLRTFVDGTGAPVRDVGEVVYVGGGRAAACSIPATGFRLQPDGEGSLHVVLSPESCTPVGGPPLDSEVRLDVELTSPDADRHEEYVSQARWLRDGIEGRANDRTLLWIPTGVEARFADASLPQEPEWNPPEWVSTWLIRRVGSEPGPEGARGPGEEEASASLRPVLALHAAERDPGSVWLRTDSAELWTESGPGMLYVLARTATTQTPGRPGRPLETTTVVYARDWNGDYIGLECALPPREIVDRQTGVARIQAVLETETMCTVLWGTAPERIALDLQWVPDYRDDRESHVLTIFGHPPDTYRQNLHGLAWNGGSVTGEVDDPRGFPSLPQLRGAASRYEQIASEVTW
jgi:hypothetical protein